MKRAFDVVFSLMGLIIFLPLFVVVALLISIDSRGGVFFLQQRVGKDSQFFRIYKFRTMVTNSENKNLLTIGDNDSRVTKVGYILRKYKIDELPQLINVLIGNMSFVGPRPEVEKYVNHYSDIEKKILTVLPGITSEASIIYRNEPEILKRQKNPELYYTQIILPEKNRLNLQYLEKQSFWYDIKIIVNTLVSFIT